jgi:hypothetical protein
VAGMLGERAQVPFLALARLIVGRDAAVDGHLSQLNPRDFACENTSVYTAKRTSVSVPDTLLSNKDTSGTTQIDRERDQVMASPVPYVTAAQTIHGKNTPPSLQRVLRSGDITMKVSSALGIAVALVMVSIGALLLTCQVGYNQHVWLNRSLHGSVAA